MAITLPVGSLLFIDINPDYSATALYNPGDKIYYNGTLWKRKTGALTTIGQTPATVSTFWEASTDVWTKLSEHNRQPVSLSTNRIERSERMANGTMRKIFIADKSAIQVSWNMLPSTDTMTVDGGYGAEQIRTFYKGKGVGAFKLKISYNGVSARDEIISVMITDCSFTLNKRNVKEKIADVAQEFWDVSLTLDQV
jgi:hypothetical protein